MERVILITGANNGIGLAMTQTLLEMGDRAAALDLSLKNLASTSHPNLLPLRCDGFQLWVTYHFRVQMGKLLTMMTEWAKKQ
jgi:NAD(P)-dependent dehydrogenase (short-subunit alcohol dehydrogenase family)